jgi:hypothetical protein
MKLAFLTAIGAGAIAFAASAPADAQRYFFRNWQTIGYKTVSGGIDRDRISVRGDRRYRAVRLCVFNAPLVMRDFDIRYDNGRRQDVGVRQRIRAGTCTRAIDLAGGRRDIRYIELTYSPIARRYARPIVRVQAR